jgi:hypothetical protein
VTACAASFHAADGREEGPLECWWRTSTSAVRVGEVFTSVLTCAAADTTALTAVVDRSRLDPVVAQWPPFEVLGGRHTPDLIRDGRRFFQYEYKLRIISDALFNLDVSFPGLPITYRVRSTTVGEESAIEGAARTYALPPMAVRVLSLVPDTAQDIRDTTSATFADLDEARLRADAMVRSGIALSVLAVGVALVGLTRFAGTRRSRTSGATRVLADATVLRGISRELTAIAREREASGWTSPLIGRALAALRVLAAYALRRPVQQRRAPFDGPVQDGGVHLRRVVVSAAVTGAAARRLAEAAPAREGRAMRLDGLVEALGTFTSAQYSRDPAVVDAALDEGLTSARHIASRLTFARGRLGRLSQALAGSAQQLRRRMGSRWAA